MSNLQDIEVQVQSFSHADALEFKHQRDLFANILRRAYVAVGLFNSEVEPNGAHFLMEEEHFINMLEMLADEDSAIVPMQASEEMQKVGREAIEEAQNSGCANFNTLATFVAYNAMVEFENNNRYNKLDKIRQRNQPTSQKS